MPSAESSDALEMRASSSVKSDADDKEFLERRRRQEQLVMLHQLSAITCSLLTLQPRTALLNQLSDGKVQEVAKLVNRGAALVALSDFLIQPSAGALSDRRGRRPIMLLTPAVTMPLKLLVCIKPTVLTLLIDKSISDALRTLGGTSMAYNVLQDLYAHGEEFTCALSRLQSVTGLGIVLAPAFSSALSRFAGGNQRFAFAVAAALSAAHLVIGGLYLEETLPTIATIESLRSPTNQLTNAPASNATSGSADAFDGGDKPKENQSPAVASKSSDSSFRPVWHFLRLYTASAALCRRTLLFTMHCLLEGKVLQDQVSILQLAAGWNTTERSRWTSALGLAILAGGRLSSACVARIGESAWTAICHGASFAAFEGMRHKAFWAGVFLLTVGQQRRSASVSWVLAEAKNVGLGKGESVGCMASLRAASEVLAASMWELAHRYLGIGEGPGGTMDVMFLPSALVVLSELVRMMIVREPARQLSA